MSTTLLILSLLLHVVAFYFIIILYMKYSTIKDITDTQRKILEETENSMTSFLIDMKDENEKLIETLLCSTNMRMQKPMAEDRTEFKQRPNQEIKQQTKIELEQKSIELPNHLTGLDEIKDVVELKQKSKKNKQPFEIEAINLFKEGYTVEQIAKKLNKGKTEVELLLKFREIIK
ncbi:MAG TPA: Swarming motility protein SwrB [Metabacillus sp.]|nr:Swarming motility protein SwrB [Metabacillus sp.]